MLRSIRFFLKLFLQKQIGLSFLVLLAACGSINRQQGPATLNSRYNDEQPALSGDGRWLAFVSNRNGRNQIDVFDVEERRFVNLPGLNQKESLSDSPSLSRTGRYIVYLSSIQGKPGIVLYDRATKRSELLTQFYPSWLRNPKISPDGRYIVFETARRGQWDIEVLDRGLNIELDIADGTQIISP